MAEETHRGKEQVVVDGRRVLPNALRRRCREGGQVTYTWTSTSSIGQMMKKYSSIHFLFMNLLNQ
jgi:hypothetical protein